MNAGKGPDKTTRVETDVLAAMKKPGIVYLGALGFCATLFVILLICWGYQIKDGMGVAGI
ncbi:MAG: hypothetical protein GTN70_00915, partial [Deltaproteobacteria bacterium]|nr:hypothetical protein [Deltaproteobacteria bacterium]NIS76214.1 hypothetical protein [Deltaproteobacteria bacterium]